MTHWWKTNHFLLYEPYAYFNKVEILTIVLWNWFYLSNEHWLSRVLATWMYISKFECFVTCQVVLHTVSVAYVRDIRLRQAFLHVKCSVSLVVARQTWVRVSNWTICSSNATYSLYLGPSLSCTSVTLDLFCRAFLTRLCTLSRLSDPILSSSLRRRASNLSNTWDGLTHVLEYSRSVMSEGSPKMIYFENS